MSTGHVPPIRLGGPLMIFIFVATLVAFVVETQLTQYVQTGLAYRQPLFIFYVVHSSFSLILPAHIFYLTATTKHTARGLLAGLTCAAKHHLHPSVSPGPAPRSTFPLAAFLRLILPLSAGATIPGLCWFAAVSLASITDVTAIWNTNAFFAYVISVKLFHLRWDPQILAAVLLATFGVMVVVYGGATATEVSTVDGSSIVPTAPLVGHLLSLLASVMYGLYQVLYKKYATLPTDLSDLYRPLPTSEGEPSSSKGDVTFPPPFGLYPNMLTSAIGITTMLLLWIPLPILNVWGFETFVLPSDTKVYVAIMGISASGVAFNAGFMILLGVWGPIMTSVGGLLTIVLVFISDVIFGNAADVSLWSITGSSVIIAAFGMLTHRIFKPPT